MGLSATQMRFLMVTARKSNVEYQGQQINQARTALANQSSELYTQLMTLKAPTAPSVYKYVIEPPILPNIDWADNNAYPLTGEESENFMIYYSGNQPQFRNFNIPEYKAVEEKDEDGKVTRLGWQKFLGTDEKGVKQYSDKVYTDEELKNTTFCHKATGIDGNGNSVQYYALEIGNNSDYTYNPETGMFAAAAGASESSLPKWLQAYNLASNQYNIYSKPSKKAIYQTGADISDKDNMPKVEEYSASATTNANQAEYNAALEQYKIDLADYEKACDEINAKTEEIHEADKRLELQLKQLDTEQEAIQTEYDALSKVLNKNIEQTFKTFG